MIEPVVSLQTMDRKRDDGPSRFRKIRLDRNERTYPFSDKIIERIRERIDSEQLMIYPEPGPLYEKVASYIKQPKERILFHLGSDLSIKSIFETYITPGDKILLHRPGYAMFSVYSQIFGTQPVYQLYDTDLSFDYDRYIGAIDSTIKMAVLENPNGFVGSAPPKRYLHAFIQKCEEEGVLAVIDEAYYPFHETTAADLLDNYENLVVVRSFSKAFGLAGVRGGYLLSSEENISNIFKVKPMHELTGFAILVIDELLNHPEEIDNFVQSTREDLNYLKKGFEELGIPTSRSVCNFLAARLGTQIDTSKLRAILMSEDILLRRPFEEAHLYEWVRIGTSYIDSEKRVLEVIKELLSDGMGDNAGL